MRRLIHSILMTCQALEYELIEYVNHYNKYLGPMIRFYGFLLSSLV
jgi:hypothetical protein